MKNTVGIKKEIDRIGRIVIPKEFRERYGLADEVEIVATEAGILIRNPEYKLIKIPKE
jgi:AbrB family looped-hinge helix DNA binding protein